MFTELPKVAPGLANNNRTADSHFGKPETIEAILRVGRLWAERYPASAISIGQMSRQKGGLFPPHKSHRLGVDVDVRPIRNDLKNAPVTCEDKVNYSREMTRAMIQMFRANAKVKLVLFNDSVLVAEGLCQPYPNHSNHLHIRLLY